VYTYTWTPSRPSLFESDAHEELHNRLATHVVAGWGRGRWRGRRAGGSACLGERLTSPLPLGWGLGPGPAGDHMKH